MEEEFETYLVEYNYDGSTWGAEIKASSFEDAEARLARMVFARVIGIKKFTIPAAGGSFIASIFCRIANFFQRGE